MEKDNIYYRDMMLRYLHNECTSEELKEMLDYIGKSDSNRLLLEQMYVSFKASLQNNTLPELSGWSSRVRTELLKNINTRKAIPFYKKPLFRVAVVLLLFLSAGGYFYFRNSPKTTNDHVASERKGEVILPGGDKATLTLSDGSVIELNEAANGEVSTQGNVKVIKTDGKIHYNHLEADSREIAYNTVTTPRGGQYIVELSDGSKVWLNAASSLRFPVSFSGASRNVELTGEGYFEIAQSKSADGTKQPFYVTINTTSGKGGSVEVLGTHFNIMAYDDEGEINTTLLEGAVKVNTTRNAILLKPGQQVQVNKATHQAEVLTNIDMESVMAWKNGEFRFDNKDVKSIMKQIGRWYDVNIIYNDNIPEIELSGKIARKNDIGQLLEILEATHKVQFSIKEKNVFVAPYKKQ